MSGRPGTSQLHRISALRASSAVAAGTPRAKSPPPRFSAFHPAHVVASQSLEPCTKSYRAPAQAHISQPIVAQVAHIAHTSIKSPTTTTRSSPHLPTYLKVRFPPPLYTEVDALLGCWSMVTVCQERPWTPAVHTDAASPKLVPRSSYGAAYSTAADRKAIECALRQSAATACAPQLAAPCRGSS